MDTWTCFGLVYYVCVLKKSIIKYLKSNMQYLDQEMSFLWNQVWGNVVRKRLFDRQSISQEKRNAHNILPLCSQVILI